MNHFFHLEVPNGSSSKVKGAKDASKNRSLQEVLRIHDWLLVRLFRQIFQVLHKSKRLGVPIVENTLGRSVRHRLEVSVSSVGWVVCLCILVSMSGSECFVIVARRPLDRNMILIHHFVN